MKNGLPFVNKLSPEESAQKNALIYGDATVADLVSKDTDGDGVPDWEEPLWGLDPTQRETVAGVPDISTVNKLKAEGGIGRNNSENPETLTETDKFSRELFSSVAALNQAGAMDETTVEKISSSLVEHIKNSPQRKVYMLSDLKISSDNSVASIKKFKDTLNSVYAKYPIQGVVLEILQKFIIDENNADAGALAGLTPIIGQTRARMNSMLSVQVPESLSAMYLAVLNSGEKLVENLEDIQVYDTDPVVALGGIAQYEKNANSLGEAIGKLMTAISEKLKN